MTSLLNAIEGLTVTEADIVHDYVQLAFGNKIGLSIYNEVKIDPSSASIDRLVGKIVASVIERENCIEITFAGGMRVLIDMHQQAYRGPEALQLNRHGLPPVIWN